VIEKNYCRRLKETLR